jgi:hypothetical protein
MRVRTIGICLFTFGGVLCGTLFLAPVSWAARVGSGPLPLDVRQVPAQPVSTIPPVRPVSTIPPPSPAPSPTPTAAPSPVATGAPGVSATRVVPTTPVLSAPRPGVTTPIPTQPPPRAGGFPTVLALIAFAGSAIALATGLSLFMRSRRR